MPEIANWETLGVNVATPGYHFGDAQFPPGSYLLVAEASVDGRRYRGVQSLTLGPQGVRDLAIVLEPSVDLAGKVLMQGPDADKHHIAVVTLRPGDGVPWNDPELRANINKDGSFKISDVPPGIWDINVNPIPAAGYIKSMRLGDQDVLTQDMVIHSSTTESLTIVLGTPAAIIEGDVVTGKEPSPAMVLLAPDGKLRHLISLYRFVVADGNGHFQIKDATPGSYRLFAFDEFDPQSIEDPDFLTLFESLGVPVTLREGTNTSQNLNLIRTGQPRSPGAGPSQVLVRQ